MNAPGLIAYLLVFPACALLLHSPALAFVLQRQSWEALAKRALQWTINLALWMAPLCFILPVFNQALAGVKLSRADCFDISCCGGIQVRPFGVAQRFGAKTIFTGIVL